ncbi:Na+/H+ antiporter subunit E [Microbulbifer sp. OS29]|uniref:Na+/H+ antiporter subunit E n=1 Tax=Microbulbifer okhotskensis TaxID=2926617 RepID=A0A9X2EQF2_9GAMM|nr:Na+/H+ antiporter subunit E [Microbulbifer okhotskensis]MCO1335435.1 Na+/H+ antiporter subunit E [Microbulbifer okhotskensis]
MRVFLLNLLLAISWSVLTGDATVDNFCFGFLIGFLALRVSPWLPGGQGYFTRLPRIAYLSFFFLEELVLSSLRASYEVFSPKLQSRPLVVRLPMERLDQNQIFLLTNLISLTPGTMVLDVTPDNDALIVHTMFVSDPETFREEIREGFEKRVKEATS